MTEFNEFRRMHYFKGFFTTAEDWQGEQNYHREKLRLHNRGLHTPGVLQGVGGDLPDQQDLRVHSIGGLTLQVRPGAAIDGNGNEINLSQPRTLTIQPGSTSLPKTFYVVLSYGEHEDEPTQNTAVPEYSGNKRVVEEPVLGISEQQPDNLSSIELARIYLHPGAVAVSDAADPALPVGNEIDLRYVPVAGARCVVDQDAWLSVARKERLTQLMGRTRKDFAALAGRFPSPSVEDVRHGALSIEMMARIGYLRTEHLAGLLAALADCERDAGQEIGVAYPELVRMKAYQDYADAVDRLLGDIGVGDPETILTSQDVVAEAARELSEIVIQLPEAEAGPPLVVTTAGTEGLASLDASGSRAFGGRTISRYRWTLQSSAAAPLASAGSDLTLTTNSGEATVSLDGSGSRAAAGGRIVSYRWDKR
ncbi:MAG: hypothetical protein HZC44_00140 [Geobacter sp.]|nr:hypothetical protein [Geobacter sp.]